MPAIELTADLLGRIAGWQVMKEARGLLAAGRVQESRWSPPRLDGLVREGTAVYRTGLVLHNAIDVDNLCSCRRARTDGTICAHAVAVGLHWLAAPQAAPDAPATGTPAPGRAGPPPAAPAGLRTGAGATSSPGPRRVLQRAGPGEPAEDLALHAIFPPNCAEALAKGKVMVVFEAERRGRRAPLNTLPLDTPFRIEPPDAAILDVLAELSGDGAPAMLLLGGPDLGRLLPKLAGHPRLTLGRQRPLEVTLTPATWPLRAQLETTGEITLAWDGAAPALLAAGPVPWCLQGGRLQPLQIPAAARDLVRGPVRLPRTRVPLFLSQDWPGLAAGGQVRANFTLSDFILDTPAPRFRLRLLGSLVRLEAQLTCEYGGHAVTPGDAGGESFCFPDPAAPKRYALRDLGAEQAAAARLARCGFAGPHPNGRLLLDGETAVLNFFAREFPRIEREWAVTLEEHLDRAAQTRLERIEPRFAITPSGEQWFDLTVSFASAGGDRFAAADIQRLVLAGQSHVRLRNGRLALIDTGAVEELQQVLLDCNPEQTGQGYRLDNAHAGFLQSTLRERGGWVAQAPRAWLERTPGGPEPGRSACPPLGALETVLRPYQKLGVAWLWSLRQRGYGGILADEMGLGKTLQALAFLAAARGAGQAPMATAAPPPPAARPAPSLVICPTSLVFNWAAEAAKFVPHLNVLALQGPDRHARFREISGSDLVVTSYALARRDVDRYGGLEFDTVVLDEAQHIKNRDTQNAQAVKAIRSRHRIVLTGTPLENSVLDLWSIFDFLMPGYLGGAAEFRERYELPITRDRDAGVQTRLARRVRPFLLRRLKQDVAPDLPEKLEQVALCDLTSDQAAVYRQLLEAGRREVLEAVGTQGLARSRMIVLTTLLRLRQACCDLRLLQLPDLDPAGASAKLDLLDELLEEVLDGGHRALVFSQFTTMLALIRERLQERGIAFCYLDGATRDRGAVVQQFQGRPDIPVFLISLKAGGTGLNLTGADTVIHFDPWWNPAVEAQATDRAHRLGQTRLVTSYRLIARGTVEEKILNLQNRKRDVINATLGSEDPVADSLDWEDIQDLLT